LELLVLLVVVAATLILRHLAAVFYTLSPQVGIVALAMLALTTLVVLVPEEAEDMAVEVELVDIVE